MAHMIPGTMHAPPRVEYTDVHPSEQKYATANQIIRNSFLDTNYQSSWSVHSLKTVKNYRLYQLYQAKARELKGQHRDTTEFDMFTCYKTMDLIRNILENGLQTRQSSFNFLGDSRKGVNLCRHADIQLKAAENTGQEECYLIMYKVMLGKALPVLPSPDNEKLNPVEGFDSHISNAHVTKDSPLGQQAIRSQVFCYEYLNNELSPCPRHVLPYVVVCYRHSQRGPPPSLPILPPAPPPSHHSLPAQQRTMPQLSASPHAIPPPPPLVQMAPVPGTHHMNPSLPFQPRLPPKNPFAPPPHSAAMMPPYSTDTGLQLARQPLIMPSMTLSQPPTPMRMPLPAHSLSTYPQPPPHLVRPPPPYRPALVPETVSAPTGMRLPYVTPSTSTSAVHQMGTPFIRMPFRPVVPVTLAPSHEKSKQSSQKTHSQNYNVFNNTSTGQSKGMTIPLQLPSAPVETATSKAQERPEKPSETPSIGMRLPIVIQPEAPSPMSKSDAVTPHMRLPTVISTEVPLPAKPTQNFVSKSLQPPASVPMRPPVNQAHTTLSTSQSLAHKPVTTPVRPFEVKKEGRPRKTIVVEPIIIDEEEEVEDDQNNIWPSSESTVEQGALDLTSKSPSTSEVLQSSSPAPSDEDIIIDDEEILDMVPRPEKNKNLKPLDGDQNLTSTNRLVMDKAAERSNSLNEESHEDDTLPDLPYTATSDTTTTGMDATAEPTPGTPEVSPKLDQAKAKKKRKRPLSPWLIKKPKRRKSQKKKQEAQLKKQNEALTRWTSYSNKNGSLENPILKVCQDGSVELFFECLNQESAPLRTLVELEKGIPQKENVLGEFEDIEEFELIHLDTVKDDVNSVEAIVPDELIPLHTDATLNENVDKCVEEPHSPPVEAYHDFAFDMPATPEDDGMENPKGNDFILEDVKSNKRLQPIVLVHDIKASAEWSSYFKCVSDVKDEMNLKITSVHSLNGDGDKANEETSNAQSSINGCFSDSIRHAFEGEESDVSCTSAETTNMDSLIMERKNLQKQLQELDSESVASPIQDNRASPANFDQIEKMGTSLSLLRDLADDNSSKKKRCYARLAELKKELKKKKSRRKDTDSEMKSALDLIAGGETSSDDDAEKRSGSCAEKIVHYSKDKDSDSDGNDNTEQNDKRTKSDKHRLPTKTSAESQSSSGDQNNCQDKHDSYSRKLRSGRSPEQHDKSRMKSRKKHRKGRKKSKKSSSYKRKPTKMSSDSNSEDDGKMHMESTSETPNDCYLNVEEKHTRTDEEKANQESVTEIASSSCKQPETIIDNEKWIKTCESLFQGKLQKQKEESLYDGYTEMKEAKPCQDPSQWLNTLIRLNSKQPVNASEELKSGSDNHAKQTKPAQETTYVHPKYPGLKVKRTISTNQKNNDTNAENVTQTSSSAPDMTNEQVSELVSKVMKLMKDPQPQSDAKDSPLPVSENPAQPTFTHNPVPPQPVINQPRTYGEYLAQKNLKAAEVRAGTSKEIQVSKPAINPQLPPPGKNILHNQSSKKDLTPESVFGSLGSLDVDVKEANNIAVVTYAAQNQTEQNYKTPSSLKESKDPRLRRASATTTSPRIRRDSTSSASDTSIQSPKYSSITPTAACKEPFIAHPSKSIGTPTADAVKAIEIDMSRESRSKINKTWENSWSKPKKLGNEQVALREIKDKKEVPKMPLSKRKISVDDRGERKPDNWSHIVYEIEIPKDTCYRKRTDYGAENTRDPRLKEKSAVVVPRKLTKHLLKIPLDGHSSKTSEESVAVDVSSESQHDSTSKNTRSDPPIQKGQKAGAMWSSVLGDMACKAIDIGKYNDDIRRLMEDVWGLHNAEWTHLNEQMIDILEAKVHQIDDSMMFIDPTKGLNPERRLKLMASDSINDRVAKELKIENEMQSVYDEISLLREQSHQPGMPDEIKAEIDDNISIKDVIFEKLIKDLEALKRFQKSSVVEVLPEMFRLPQERNKFISVEGNMLFLVSKLTESDCKKLYALKEEIRRHKVISENPQLGFPERSQAKLKLGWLHTERKEALCEICMNMIGAKEDVIQKLTLKLVWCRKGEQAIAKNGGLEELLQYTRDRIQNLELYLNVLDHVQRTENGIWTKDGAPILHKVYDKTKECTARHEIDPRKKDIAKEIKVVSTKGDSKSLCKIFEKISKEKDIITKHDKIPGFGSDDKEQNQAGDDNSDKAGSPATPSVKDDSGSKSNVSPNEDKGLKSNVPQKEDSGSKLNTSPKEDGELDTDSEDENAELHCVKSPMDSEAKDVLVIDLPKKSSFQIENPTTSLESCQLQGADQRKSDSFNLDKQTEKLTEGKDENKTDNSNVDTSIGIASQHNLSEDPKSSSIESVKVAQESCDGQIIIKDRAEDGASSTLEDHLHEDQRLVVSSVSESQISNLNTDLSDRSQSLENKAGQMPDYANNNVDDDSTKDLVPGVNSSSSARDEMQLRIANVLKSLRESAEKAMAKMEDNQSSSTSLGQSKLNFTVKTIQQDTIMSGQDQVTDMDLVDTSDDCSVEPKIEVFEPIAVPTPEPDTFGDIDWRPVLSSYNKPSTSSVADDSNSNNNNGEFVEKRTITVSKTWRPKNRDESRLKNKLMPSSSEMDNYGTLSSVSESGKSSADEDRLPGKSSQRERIVTITKNSRAESSSSRDRRSRSIESERSSGSHERYRSRSRSRSPYDRSKYVRRHESRHSKRSDRHSDSQAYHSSRHHDRPRRVTSAPEKEDVNINDPTIRRLLEGDKHLIGMLSNATTTKRLAGMLPNLEDRETVFKLAKQIQEEGQLKNR